MKVSQHLGILYTLLVIGQILLCNYGQFGPYVMLTLLPAMVFCIPTNIGTALGMLIAFVSGFAVDWLSEGILGLNAAAILPVALMRKSMIKIFLGEDLINRGDRFSYKKNGITKIIICLTICTAVFLAVYIFLDGAGTRPLGFCLTKGGISLACSLLLGAIIVNVLSPDDRK